MIFFHGAGAGQERTRAFKYQLLQGFRAKEQRFPKPQVAGPIPAEGASCVWPAGCMSHREFKGDTTLRLRFSPSQIPSESDA